MPTNTRRSGVWNDHPYVPFVRPHRGVGDRRCRPADHQVGVPSVRQSGLRAVCRNRARSWKASDSANSPTGADNIKRGR